MTMLWNCHCEKRDSSLVIAMAPKRQKQSHSANGIATVPYGDLAMTILAESVYSI